MPASAPPWTAPRTRPRAAAARSSTAPCSRTAPSAGTWPRPRSVSRARARRAGPPASSAWSWTSPSGGRSRRRCARARPATGRRRSTPGSGSARSTPPGASCASTRRCARSPATAGRSCSRRTVFDVTHPEDARDERADFARLVAGEVATYAREKRYLRQDGTERWVEVAATAVRDPAGRFLHGVRVVQDVTERKLAEARQRRAARRAEPPGEEHAGGGAGHRAPQPRAGAAAWTRRARSWSSGWVPWPRPTTSSLPAAGGASACGELVAAELARLRRAGRGRGTGRGAVPQDGLAAWRWCCTSWPPTR